MTNNVLLDRMEKQYTYFEQISSSKKNKEDEQIDKEKK